MEEFKEQVAENPDLMKRSKKVCAKKLYERIQKRFVFEASESSSGNKPDAFVENNPYKEDRADFEHINFNKVFIASQLSNSDEFQSGWEDFDILRGVDELVLHDGPRLFDTNEPNKVEEAKRFLLGKGVTM